MVIITTADADNNEIEAVHTNHDIIGGDSPVENNNNTLESGSASAGEGEEDNNDMEAGPDPDADLSEASIGGIGHHRPRKGQDQAGQDTSPRSSKRNWKVYLFIAVLFVCGIIGLVEFNKKSNLITSTENKDIDISISDTLQVGTAKSSKRGKSSKRSKNGVKCGDTFHGKISLRDDLVCEQGEGENDGIPNAAITLDGPKAVLNCKGFKITQDVADGAATGCNALLKFSGNLEEDPAKVQDIKNNCGLPFLYGFRLLNGAKAKGCNIENFLVGAYFGLEAKELRDVTASKNRFGVVAETNTTAKITNLILKDNGVDGIRASNNGESIFVGDYEPGGSMELKDITATGNGDDGIEIAGFDIDVIDAVATDNGFGIYIVDSEEINVKNIEADDNGNGILNNGNGILIINSEKIDLENFEGNGNDSYGIAITDSLDLELSLIGSISLNDNGFDGLFVAKSEGSITLFGDLEANDNGRFGIRLVFSSVTFSINDGASLSACGNDDGDIVIESGSSLTLGTGGTCTGSTGGPPGTIIPASACDACPTPLI